MCEILIKAIDAEHPDPIKNARGCYKKGDPVVIFEDGHEWGKEEGLPKFWVLKIPGVPADLLKHLILPQTIARIDTDGVERQEIITRRLHKLDLKTLAIWIKNSLYAKGVVKMNLASAKNYFKNKITNSYIT